jgi:pilus assembly protein Flp/PilA
MITFEYALAWLVARTRSDRGGNLVEYGLLISLIAMVCVLAVAFMGKSLSSKYSSVGSGLG